MVNGFIEDFILIENVQFVLMVVSFVVMWVLENDFDVNVMVVFFVVGYSFGEYLVLVVVGLLFIVDVVKLFKLCGQVM